MPRLLALLTLLALTVPALGVARANESVCREDCGSDAATGDTDDDTDGGCCPSDCAACACAARTPSGLPVAIALPRRPDAPTLAPALAVALAPLDPDPREILHVPRR